MLVLERTVETDRIERLRLFGQELRSRRKELGIDQKVLAVRLGISNQHLSQLETAYDKPGRGPVGPSDEVISSISEALKWRKNDIHRLLGRLDEEPSEESPDDPILNVIQKAGYDAQQFGTEDLQRLNQGLELAIEGILAQKRKAQGRD